MSDPAMTETWRFLFFVSLLIAIGVMLPFVLEAV